MSIQSKRKTLYILIYKTGWFGGWYSYHIARHSCFLYYTRKNPSTTFFLLQIHPPNFPNIITNKQFGHPHIFLLFFGKTHDKLQGEMCKCNNTRHIFITNHNENRKVEENTARLQPYGHVQLQQNENKLEFKKSTHTHTCTHWTSGSRSALQ